jgi:hypothetical protein
MSADEQEAAAAAWLGEQLSLQPILLACVSIIQNNYSCCSALNTQLSVRLPSKTPKSAASTGRCSP